MDRLSTHFTLAEFERSQTASRLRIPNRAPPSVIARLKVLSMKVLEPVRAWFGAVSINSGYRSPALNRQIGGAPASQHVLGEAADIECPGRANAEVAAWIAANLAFDQLILEFYTPGVPASGWVHVSYREGRLRREVLTITKRGTFKGLKA